MPECLDSLINQSLRDIEIICVNDGSTDSSQEILERYSKKDQRIKTMSQENQGASSARNLALKEAQGEYICIVDSDDYIEADTLEKAYYRALEKKLDAVIFNLVFVGTKTKYLNINSNEILSGQQAVVKSLDWSISGLGIFASEIIKKIKFDTFSMNADELSTRKFFLACKKLGFTKARYFYRQYSSSTTKKFSIKHFDKLETDLRLREFLKSNDLYQKASKIFEPIAFGSFVGLNILFLREEKAFTKTDKAEILKKLETAYDSFDLKFLKKMIGKLPLSKRLLFSVLLGPRSFSSLQLRLKPLSIIAKMKK